MASLRQKEDVYESEDLPEADRNVFPRNEVNDSEHIELVHIDMEAAKKRFEGRILNCRGVDFSDSIAKKRLAAYGSSAYVLEVVGQACAEPETPEQKFNRLTYELNELAETLSKPSENGVSNSLLNPSAVNELLEELKDIKASKASGAPIAVSKDGKNAASRQLAGTNEASLIPLEQRLRRVEAIVGPFDGSRQSLVETVEDLKLRADSLNPVYVEGLETRLNQVLTKLDQAEEKREKSVDGDFEAKVNELLALMEKWDAACASLPANVKKVQALHRLHEQAQHFSERLAQLAGLRDSVEKAVATDRDTLRELQARAKEDIGALMKEIGVLEKRVQGLEK